MTPILHFGKRHRGTPLAAVPTAYLVWLLAHAQVRARHPKVVADVLGEVACRLLVDYDAVLDDLLVPIPPEILANAKARNLQAKRAKLVKLIERHRGTP